MTPSPSPTTEGCMARSILRGGHQGGHQAHLGREAYIAPNKHTDKRARIDDWTTHLYFAHRDQRGLPEPAQAHLDLVPSTVSTYKPRMDKDLLRQYGKGIIALSGCLRARSPRPASRMTWRRPNRRRWSIARSSVRIIFFLELVHHPESAAAERRQRPPGWSSAASSASRSRGHQGRAPPPPRGTTPRPKTRSSASMTAKGAFRPQPLFHLDHRPLVHRAGGWSRPSRRRRTRSRIRRARSRTAAMSPSSSARTSCRSTNCRTARIPTMPSVRFASRVSKERYGDAPPEGAMERLDSRARDHQAAGPRGILPHRPGLGVGQGMA